jgi:hypothetical protein
MRRQETLYPDGWEEAKGAQGPGDAQEAESTGLVDEVARSAWPERTGMQKGKTWSRIFQSKVRKTSEKGAGRD